MIGHFLVNLQYFLLRNIGPKCPAVQEIIIELYLIGLIMLLNRQLAVDLTEIGVLAAGEEQLNVCVFDDAKGGEFCGELGLFEVEEGSEEGGVIVEVFLDFCEG